MFCFSFGKILLLLLLLLILLLFFFFFFDNLIITMGRGILNVIETLRDANQLSYKAFGDLVRIWNHLERHKRVQLKSLRTLMEFLVSSTKKRILTK